MGRRIEISEISKLVVVYFVLITMCCDKYANCDTTIHAMRQRQLADSGEVDFKINATELHEHIMRGLNMTKKPDIRLVSTRDDDYAKWICVDPEIAKQYSNTIYNQLRLHGDYFDLKIEINQLFALFAKLIYFALSPAGIITASKLVYFKKKNNLIVHIRPRLSALNKPVSTYLILYSACLFFAMIRKWVVEVSR